MAKRRNRSPRRCEEVVTPTPRRSRIRPWLPVGLFALLSLVYFSQVVLTDHIVLGNDSGQDLYQGARLSLTDKLATFSQPMWDERMGGFPSAEEIRPQYFPLYLIYLFTTYQRYLSWRYIFTAFFAGWGMFVLVRQLGVGRLVATWAGVAYLSAPTFLSFTLAGHYAKMGVIALFPWMVMWLFRGMRERRLAHFALLGATIGIAAYSPHPQMLYYALLALGIIFLYLLVDIHLHEHKWSRSGVRVGLFALAVVLGLASGAEGIFPLYYYTRTQSKRADVGTDGSAATARQLERARSYSLHPEEVASLVIPEFGGFSDQRAGRDYYWGRNPFKINSEYFGVLAVLLALVAVVDPRRSRLTVFFGALFLLVLAYSLGGHTPVHTLAFYLLPGVKVMRAVGMVAFVFAFAAILLASLGLHALLEPAASEETRNVLARRLLLIGGVLSGMALLTALAPRAVTHLWIALFYSSITPEKQAILAGGYHWLSRGALLVGLVAAAGTVLLYLRLRGNVSAGWVVAGICVLTVLDTWRIDRVFLRYEDPARHADIRDENRDVVRFIEQGGERLRIFPIPDYRLLETPGYHLYGIPTVTGFHDFTIARYDRFLRELQPVIGWLQVRYYQGREVPRTDAELLESIAPLLDLANARYLVAPAGAALHSKRFPLVFNGSRLQVYANRKAMPYFYLTRSLRVARNGEQALRWLRSGRIELPREAVVEREPTYPHLAPETVPAADSLSVREYDLAAGRVRLDIACAGKRILVFSQNFHPNWHARVDDEPVAILRTDFIWQGIPLPPGRHTVELVYHSPVVAWSRTAGLAAVLIMLSIGVREAWRPWRRRREAACAGVQENFSC